MGRAEQFTVTEASVITGAPVSRINRLFDEGPLPRPSGARSSRRLRGPELALVVATSDAPLSHLDPAGKREVYEAFRRHLAKRRAGDQIELGRALVVRFDRLAQRVSEGRRRLEEAKALVVRDPDIRGGEPVIGGTRIPVYLIGDLVKVGVPTEELLQDYPSLSAEHIALAEVFVRAYPRRGRPPRHPWHG